MMSCFPSICIDSSERSVARAIYVNPSADGSVPGHVILDRNAPETLPKYQVPVLMVHEAEPGHHMQVLEYLLTRISQTDFLLQQFFQTEFLLL